MSAAVFLPGVDAAVPAHYGQPLAEQRQLLTGQAVVDLSHRSVVTVTGPDRLSWLHSLTTQHLTDLTAGSNTELLILSPKGHIEYHLKVHDDGETTWLLGEPESGAPLAAWLDSMRFLLRVEVADVSTDWATFLVPAELPHRGVVTWQSAWPTLGPDTASYAPDVAESEHPGLGWQFVETLVPRDEAADFASGTPRAGTWAVAAGRVASWLPRQGFETDHRTIPHELDWLRTTVHLHKGCYRGQETIARVKNLGKPPRRLVHLHLDGSGHELPAEGSDVVFGPRTVGRLTTVATHYEDGPIALAVIKRSVPRDAELLVAGAAVAQQPIVWVP